MKPYFVVLLVIMLLSVLISCHKSIKDNQIKIGIILPSIDHLPLTIAMEKDYVNNTGIKVISFTSGWEVQEAMTSGELDMAIMPFTYTWTAISKGYKLKTVSCLERETDGIVALPKYKNLKALNNQKIGLLRASTLEILLQDAAKQYDILYQPVYFRSPIEMIAALRAKEVEAIVCYVPLIQKINNDFTVLYWFSESYPAHPCCDLVVTEDLLRNQPEAISSIQDGISKAIKDIDSQSESVFKLTEKLYGLTALQTIDALRHTHFDNRLTEKDKQFELQMMQSFLSNGYLKDIPAIEDVFVK